MKHIIHIIILTLGLFSNIPSYGQKLGDTNKEINYQQGLPPLNISFDNLLVELKDKDSVATFKAMIDSISKNWYLADTSTISLRLTDKWNLKYFQYAGVEIHTQPEIFTQYFICTNTDTSFTSEQIFNEFNILDSISQKENLLKYLPFIYERNDQLKSKWTATLPDTQYLVIRMVNSYPDGNETSWTKEWIYYFKKTDI